MSFLAFKYTWLWYFSGFYRNHFESGIHFYAEEMLIKKDSLPVNLIVLFHDAYRQNRKN